MDKIKLFKKVELNAKKVGDKIICYDMATVNLILGTSSASSNLHMYGCSKRSFREWVIPIKSIKKRIETVERNRNSLDTRLKFMKQVVKYGSKRN